MRGEAMPAFSMCSIYLTESHPQLESGPGELVAQSSKPISSRKPAQPAHETDTSLETPQCPKLPHDRSLHLPVFAAD